MTLTAETVSQVSGLIRELAALTVQQRVAAAERSADVIACGADVLWAGRVPRKAEVTPDDVREALVTGLAILALRPGGVAFGGLHWCTDSACPDPGAWTLTGQAATRQARGAVFTPRDFAEETTFGALEDLVYQPGPRDTADTDAWRLRPAVHILQLRIGDIAVGSGVFLLAACRFLAARLTEAWQTEAGEPIDQLPVHHPMALAARRLAMRCLHGVDIDPTSVELCRVALALLAPTSPVDLASQIVCGDSMLGITNIDQLAFCHLDPAVGREQNLHTATGVDPELWRLLAQVEAHIARERV